jgi:hypothetical protein
LGAKAAQNRVKIWIYSQKMEKNITFLEKKGIKSLFFLILGSHYVTNNRNCRKFLSYCPGQRIRRQFWW